MDTKKSKAYLSGGIAGDESTEATADTVADISIESEAGFDRSLEDISRKEVEALEMTLKSLKTGLQSGESLKTIRKTIIDAAKKLKDISKEVSSVYSTASETEAAMDSIAVEIGLDDFDDFEFTLKIENTMEDYAISLKTFNLRDIVNTVKSFNRVDIADPTVTGSILDPDGVRQAIMDGTRNSDWTFED